MLRRYDGLINKKEIDFPVLTHTHIGAQNV
jgi:hypothetical protein